MNENSDINSFLYERIMNFYDTERIQRFFKTLLATAQVQYPKVCFETRKILYDAFHVILHIL